MTIEEARTLWQREGIYLNTASYGLPPTPAWDALQAALADWRVGRTSWEHWNEATQAARGSFARLCGVPPEWVAVGGAVSHFVGLIAAALPDRSRVLSTEAEFTSALWPFMAQGRGMRAGGAARGGDRRPHGCRGLQRRAVLERRAGRAR
jgi:selenocysteine lyase/cysteine desulfurase